MFCILLVLPSPIRSDRPKRPPPPKPGKIPKRPPLPFFKKHLLLVTCEIVNLSLVSFL